MNNLSKANKKVIVKRFENTFALWFQNSKSFLLLKEPAFEVFQNYVEGVPVENITKMCKKKYGHLESNIPQFVNEIIQHIQYYLNPANNNNISQKELVTASVSPKSVLSPINYKTGKKIVSVYYGSERIKFAIHPLIAHLETNKNEKLQHKLECFENNGLLISKYNGKVIEAFRTSDVEYFTGGVRQLMYSILYNTDYNNWMSMLHASGITAGNRAILFSAAAGSGKSTISAILKAHGYGFLGDDFIATGKNGNAFAFPAAISIKEGSVKILSEFYPELTNVQTVKTFIGKSVKYIPVFNLINEWEKGTPVTAFVFVQYSKSGEFIFENVKKTDALQLLLKETWVNPEPEIVTRFLNWVEETPFFKLQYSHTQQALDAVKQILTTLPTTY